jgi:hypothetical protein
VSQVGWSNDRGGNGTATGTASWTAASIALQSGANVITVTARDAAGNTSTASITVTRNEGTAVLPAPAGLSAVSGNAQVSLSWSAVTNATGYNIKRATVSGGPYATVQAAHTTVSYTDTSVANGTTYYYVVSAVSAANESVNSTAVSATPAAPSSGGSLALPRIAWEGGPEYYRKFPQATAMGWTDPGFFPIAAWGAMIDTQGQIDSLKDAGINTVMEIYSSAPNLALARANGISLIHGVRGRPDLGNETVGWFLIDEPEGVSINEAGSLNRVLGILQERAALYPADGRMRVTNHTGHMFFPTMSPGDATSASWLDVSDLVSLDVYWYGRPLHCGGSISGEIWKDGSGPSQPHGSGYNDLSLAECHRPHNYGRQVQDQRRLAALSGKREPVFTFVENGSPFESGTVYTITPDQMAGAVWNSIIHEARGVAYFNLTMNDQTGCYTANNLDHPCYTAMRAKAKELHTRIKQLAPVINTQSYEHTFNSNLDTMLKEHGGAYYIFAMPTGIKGGSATGTHTLQLPAGLNGSTAQVLFEDRTLTIDSSRRLTDTFAADTTIHIYKITP